MKGTLSVAGVAGREARRARAVPAVAAVEARDGVCGRALVEIDAARVAHRRHDRYRSLDRARDRSHVDLAGELLARRHTIVPGQEDPTAGRRGSGGREPGVDIARSLDRRAHPEGQAYERPNGHGREGRHRETAARMATASVEVDGDPGRDAPDEVRARRRPTDGSCDAGDPRLHPRLVRDRRLRDRPSTHDRRRVDQVDETLAGDHRRADPTGAGQSTVAGAPAADLAHRTARGERGTDAA